MKGLYKGNKFGFCPHCYKFRQGKFTVDVPIHQKYLHQDDVKLNKTIKGRIERKTIKITNRKEAGENKYRISDNFLL